MAPLEACNPEHRPLASACVEASAAETQLCAGAGVRCGLRPNRVKSGGQHARQ